jgi:hypothetical protein
MVKVPNGMHVGQRLERQLSRISQGVESGELTGREAARLLRREARVVSNIARDVVDGGRFTARERAQAQAALNRRSADIFVQKHDGQQRAE